MISNLNANLDKIKRPAKLRDRNYNNLTKLNLVVFKKF